MLNNDEPILTALRRGKLTIRGEFLWGSNYTFFGSVEHRGKRLKVVYKPTRGERPLWDFPEETLAHREVAAYLVSQALGWRLVPPTVYRQDGPAGAGSLQRYIDHDPEYHYLTFSEEDRQRLRPVALFDLLINNADRKAGHILLDADRHIWLIDHGICFHVENKLRTVLWEFAGEPLPGECCADVERLVQQLAQADGIAAELGHHISQVEIQALIRRGQRLLGRSKFPVPDPHQRAIPWPPV